MTVKPYLTEEQLDASVKPIIEEYLEHGNSTEVEVSGETEHCFIC